MAFDLTQQLRGPEVSISLFGDAAKAGAEVGKTVGNPVSSIIGGAQEGYSTALKWNQEQAETQRINLQNQILDAQAAIAQQDKDAQLKIAAQKTQSELTQATQLNTDLDNGTKIANALASGDINAISSIYTDPSLQGTLQRKPELADSVYGKIYGDPTLPQELRQKAYGEINLSKQRAYDAQIARVQTAQIDKLSGKYLDGLTAARAVISDLPGANPQGTLIPEEELLKNYEIVPHGYYKTDVNGKRLLKDDHITPDINPDYAKDVQFKTLTQPNDVFRGGQLIGSTTNANRDKWTASLGNINEYRVASHMPTSTASRIGLPDASGQVSSSSATPTLTPGQAVRIEPTISPNAAGPITTLNDAKTQSNQNPNVNSNIVDKALQDFRQAEQSAPPGVAKGLEQRLIQKKQAVEAKFGSAYSPTFFSNQAANIPTVSQVNYTVPSVKSSDENLSHYLGPNTSFNFQAPPPLKSKVIDRIQAEPLLNGEAPIFKGLAAAESMGNKKAVSPVVIDEFGKKLGGVHGLLQVTKGTAADYGLNSSIPEENFLAGKLYLTDLAIKYDGNLPIALAAYNVGPGTMHDAIRATKSTDWGTIKGYLQQHLSPTKFKEVKDYPERVLSYAAQFMQPQDQSSGALAYLLKRNGLVTNEAWS